MRRFVVLALGLWSFQSIYAQALSISGTINDQQNKVPLSHATVRLRSLTDSSFSRSTTTDSTGRFAFTGLSRDSFRLAASYVGYNVITRTIKLDTTSVNVNIAATQSSSSELATVVITANVAPVTQKEDTLQVSANQFKVNPDATGEDLMRKVPGVTIENGQVKAQGENVQKVTIDGRELFGDDATAALRNLPAEIIDKIQIFDRLSDQAQFSGFDDGNTTKGINIITKANMRNGQFGRVFAGYGTDDRYQVGGNATIFKGNRRISLVGNLNNVNQQNFQQQDLLGVTSNAQRGGGGGGPRGGGGGPRGGSGNRGSSGAGGNQGGGNYGGFGNNANFLVGQQNGINQTKAAGINYSDVWLNKINVTGSYFFNNTRNNTYELANTQYFSGTTANSLDTTTSNSNNYNHRVNMRLEYKIDSANSILYTPNLSWQDNTTNRSTGRLANFISGFPLTSRINDNNTNSTRLGNNLNNTLLFRHSFPKRGRTLSLNLNSSTNKRTGDSYVSTFQHSAGTTTSLDTSSERYTNQVSNGNQLSANLMYTEPIGKNSQVQLNYSPSISHSNSDQETYGYNTTEKQYSNFLDSLSNKFRNTTTAQNGGISYRYGNRDHMLVLGASYQHTNLQSDQTFPRTLSVDKSFDNILPNAMFRYKLSPRSSMRLFYRANVFQPSVTQLQNVLDITNAPFYTAGNPELAPQYMHILSSQYTYTNTAKGLLFVGNIYFQGADNYIANATYTPTRDSVVQGYTLKLGDQLNKPVNVNGYRNFRSFLTFALPVKFIKSNFNLNGGFSLTKTPGIINNLSNVTQNTTLTVGGVVASNVSQYVDFTLSYTANFNNATNTVVPSLNDRYFQQTAGVLLNLLSKKGWFFQNDLNNQYYSGLAQGFNQNYFLWNMAAGKKFLKDQKGELKLSVFDLLKQNRSITRNVTETYIQDVQDQVLRQYFMLTFTYNLRNFGTAASRAFNRQQGQGNWHGRF
jgi:uncharacterized membrane protein YgcG